MSLYNFTYTESRPMQRNSFSVQAARENESLKYGKNKSNSLVNLIK